MGMTNIVSANNARQLAWCFEHKTVVEHLYLANNLPKYHISNK